MLGKGPLGSTVQNLASTRTNVKAIRFIYTPSHAARLVNMCNIMYIYKHTHEQLRLERNQIKPNHKSRKRGENNITRLYTYL